MTRTSSIRTALVGVGNCASALLQGLTYYGEKNSDASNTGLLHPLLGPYHVRAIEIVAAFDINREKVGRSIVEAAQARPNNTLSFADFPQSEVIVQKGPTLDGLGPSLSHSIEVSDAPAVSVAQILRESEADILVSYLPVGADEAARHYAAAALEAGCAFVNCMPSFVASDPLWADRFRDNHLPLIGDDIKSQLGATILHRAIANLFRERGLSLDRQYQLNFGGNADFLNMLDRERLVSKKISKTQSVTSQMDRIPDPHMIHIGPSDFVPWLDDRKICHIRLEGRGFGNAPIAIDVKLEVWDSPNSAGVAIDAIRCAKIALDRGLSGPILGPSAWFMKSPPQQFTDAIARQMTLDFIAEAEN